MCIPRIISFRGTVRLRQLQTDSSIQIISTQSRGFIPWLEILFYLNFGKKNSLSIKLLGLVLSVAFSPSHCLFALSLPFHRPQLEYASVTSKSGLLIPASHKNMVEFCNSFIQFYVSPNYLYYILYFYTVHGNTYHIDSMLLILAYFCFSFCPSLQDILSFRLLTKNLKFSLCLL